MSWERKFSLTPTTWTDSHPLRRGCVRVLFVFNCRIQLLFIGPKRTCIRTCNRDAGPGLKSSGSTLAFQQGVCFCSQEPQLRLAPAQGSFAPRRKTSCVRPSSSPRFAARVDARLASPLECAGDGVGSGWGSFSPETLSPHPGSASRAYGPTHAVRPLPLEPRASLLQFGSGCAALSKVVL
jgi:hypothetical protein